MIAKNMPSFQNLKTQPRESDYRKGYLVLDSGEAFEGRFCGGVPHIGEVVFNTSHSGYEEMATDPSYFSQILVCTAPQQGNYGVSDEFWESNAIWIKGFVCLEMQNSVNNKAWMERLLSADVPILTDVDTRGVTLKLRSGGTRWGALVSAESAEQALAQFTDLRANKISEASDWTQYVTTKESHEIKGERPEGPRVAMIDFGSKKNIVRELVSRCSAVKVFPSHVSADEILAWSPDGLMLSNGPGDPQYVKSGAETVKKLIGSFFIFGICMGHQVLSLALGAKTYKLKFGHRGSNHPVRDEILNRVYVTSQNHGYSVDPETLPEGCLVSHTNLNDNSVSGISFPEKKCMSVQFHPESCPGPHDARPLFDYFIKRVQ